MRTIQRTTRALFPPKTDDAHTKVYMQKSNRFSGVLYVHVPRNSDMHSREEEFRC